MQERSVHHSMILCHARHASQWTCAGRKLLCALANQMYACTDGCEQEVMLMMAPPVPVLRAIVRRRESVSIQILAHQECRKHSCVAEVWGLLKVCFVLKIEEKSDIL